MDQILAAYRKSSKQWSSTLSKLAQDKTHTKHLHVSQTISHSRDPAEHRCIKTTAASYSKPIVPIFHPIVNILTKNSGPVTSYHIAISEGSHKIV
ncbi:hypothetical protein JHK87_031443 [Glycine soja]|nr:hypothetical protein JHK87_031443 [Glycine soja]